MNPLWQFLDNIIKDLKILRLFGVSGYFFDFSMKKHLTTLESSAWMQEKSFITGSIENIDSQRIDYNGVYNSWSTRSGRIGEAFDDKSLDLCKQVKRSSSLERIVIGMKN